MTSRLLLQSRVKHDPDTPRVRNDGRMIAEDAYSLDSGVSGGAGPGFTAVRTLNVIETRPLESFKGLLRPDLFRVSRTGTEDQMDRTVLPDVQNRIPAVPLQREIDPVPSAIENGETNLFSFSVIFNISQKYPASRNNDVSQFRPAPIGYIDPLGSRRFPVGTEPAAGFSESRAYVDAG